jgi:serine/threonine-protein kinase
MAPPIPSSASRRNQRFLGRYELIGELARGGMGTVYLARHAGEAGFQRLFAVKVMHAHLAEEGDFVDMLRDEARLAARIHHPNVVAIVDLGSQDDLHYVVMDYVEGPPFGTLIKRSGAELNLERILTVVADTLEGIHAAHILTDEDGNELNIVHRDVSPQNILVGADGVARITDFGIAKAETRIASTRPGTRKGKLAFMSPEQITNDETVDKRADIWAAGVVLWTALAGKNLFRAESDAATMHSVLTKEIPVPSSVGRKPPAFLDEVVMRALQRKPEDRYASALEMADALRTVAAQNGLQCSRQKVASWVNELFTDELALRRKAIRGAARRREEQQEFTEASQINVLPALPSMIGGGGLTGTHSNVSGIENYTPISASHSAPTLAQPLLVTPAAGSQKGRIALVLAAAAAFGIAAYAITASLSSDPPAPAAAAPVVHAPAASPQAPPTAAAAVPPLAKAQDPNALPRTATAAEAAGDEAEGNTDEDGAREDKAASTRKAAARSYRRYARVNAPKPAAAPQEAPAEDPGGEEAASAKGKAGTAPASAPGFEKNPYLRR